MHIARGHINTDKTVIALKGLQGRTLEGDVVVDHYFSCDLSSEAAT